MVRKTIVNFLIDEKFIYSLPVEFVVFQILNVI